MLLLLDKLTTIKSDFRFSFKLFAIWSTKSKPARFDDSTIFSQKIYALSIIGYFLPILSNSFLSKLILFLKISIAIYFYKLSAF